MHQEKMKATIYLGRLIQLNEASSTVSIDIGLNGSVFSIETLAFLLFGALLEGSKEQINKQINNSV